MGGIYYVLGSGDNAIHYFDRVLQINDSDTETLLLKANVHLALKENGDARECCSRILEIDADHGGARSLLESMDGG